MSVCTSYDDYIRELEMDRGMSLWRATLSDGTTVIQDEFRPGLEQPSAWIRLAEYCQEKQLNITKLWLEFRGHREDDLPENAEGYFFRKAMLGSFGIEEQDCSIFFYLIGYLSGDKVHVQRWQAPELILIEEEIRDASASGPSLIRNAPRNGESTRLVERDA